MSVRGGRQPIEVHVDPVQFVFTDTRIDEVLKILKSIKQQGDKIMGQTEDLLAAVAQVSTDVGELVERLSQPNPNVAQAITALQGIGVTLDSLAQSAPEPPPEPEP